MKSDAHYSVYFFSLRKSDRPPEIVDWGLSPQWDEKKVCIVKEEM